MQEQATDQSGPDCTAAQIEFPVFKRRKIQAQFSGGAIISDNGVLLLRTIDQQLQLIQQIAEQMHEISHHPLQYRNVLSKTQHKTIRA